MSLDRKDHSNVNTNMKDAHFRILTNTYVKDVKKGKRLDSFRFRDEDDFELDFKTKKALKKAKRGKIQLHLEDLNGDAANFTLKNGDEADFEPDTMKTFMKIKKNKGFAKKNLIPIFEVIEPTLPDSGGGTGGGSPGAGSSNGALGARNWSTLTAAARQARSSAQPRRPEA